MEYLILVSMIWLFMVAFGLGLYMSLYIGPYKSLKRENELLNAELHKLTDRDSKGRFTGSKNK